MPVKFPIHLVKHARWEGTLTLLSGTHIGGSKDDLEIGGTDNPVIRNPVTHEPYIPGSSLKGKLRTLLEQRYPKERQRSDQPCGCGQEDCPACRLCGPHFNLNHNLGPSRLIVRDAYLTEESRQRALGLLAEGSSIYETKQETMINRRTGVAANQTLRTQERVAPSVQFQVTLSLRVFEGDDEAQLKGWVNEAPRLLHDDTLGGSGSRGYGWVRLDGRWTQ